jgi:hypothetical protein
MPSLRQTSATVSPLARSRWASRSSRPICSAFRRLLMSPSRTYPIRSRTLIPPGPDFGEQTKSSILLVSRLFCCQYRSHQLPSRSRLLPKLNGGFLSLP